MLGCALLVIAIRHEDTANNVKVAFCSNDWEIKQFFHDLNSIKIHEDKL